MVHEKNCLLRDVVLVFLYFDRFNHTFIFPIVHVPSHNTSEFSQYTHPIVVSKGFFLKETKLKGQFASLRIHPKPALLFLVPRHIREYAWVETV